MEPKDQDTKASNESQPEKGGGPNPMMMGMGMMKKMMAQMGSEGGSPMAMMQKMMAQSKPGAEGEPPMQHMMGMCMSMCAEMLTTMQQTTAMATFATPELRELFAEWLDSVAVKALAVLNEQGELDSLQLAQALGISTDGALYLLTQMARQGKVNLRAQASPT
ncbi:hypothetical protein [Enterobacter hormaechei]|uniref:hypothetical protein n=1 Tax=Enterobacter hormaechei TaxID=158836 RepID=UPI0021B37898|nr:hypothetical protein [Enterobacter hormaechei]MCT7304400.1 hypothetical protein [Enterobacter hormaechei]